MFKAIAQRLGAATASQMNSLSRQVANASVESVSLLVNDRVEGMTFSEARGYVRARATGIVRKQVRLLVLQQADGDTSWFDSVARLATEQLVPQVLLQTGVGVPKVAAQVRLSA